MAYPGGHGLGIFDEGEDVLLICDHELGWVDKTTTDGRLIMTLLTRWIEQGVSFNKKVAEVVASEDVQAILNTLVDPDANKSEMEQRLASEVTPASEDILNQLEQSRVRIRALAAGVHWLQANFSHGKAADTLIRALVEVSEQLTWLDLGGSSVTDAALPDLQKCINLTRLHLENTAVTDKGMEYIKELPHLEYLIRHFHK